MPRNDKPTETGRPRQRQGGAVNAPNEKYEHQDYPKMLYGPRGTTVSVSDPDEEAEALEGGFVEDRTELEGETILATAESGEQAAKGMARGVLPKSTSKSKMANRQQTGGGTGHGHAAGPDQGAGGGERPTHGDHRGVVLVGHRGRGSVGIGHQRRCRSCPDEEGTGAGGGEEARRRRQGEEVVRSRGSDQCRMQIRSSQGHYA
jgi:hypothetical protein